MKKEGLFRTGTERAETGTKKKCARAVLVPTGRRFSHQSTTTPKATESVVVLKLTPPTGPTQLYRGL